MRTGTAFRAAAATLIVLFLFCRQVWAWSDLVVFGDSLSDTGNLASVTVDFPWPYYRNRVSNGPLAVDVLADALGLSAEASLHLAGKSGGSNYAVDGANAGGSEREDLPTQLQVHLDRHGGLAISEALYVVMIGGNDLRDARNQSDAAQAERIVDDAVAAIRQAISALLTKGAGKVLVVNGPDIGRIPETLKKEQQTPGIAARATLLTRRFNAALGRAVDSLSTQYGVEIAQFDLFAYFNQLLADAAAHGFTNTTEGCFNPRRYEFHPECEWGSRFDRFVFFDSLHPTAKTHRLIGEAIIAALRQPAKKPVDLSPVLMLLLD
ncbi:MAG: SGNH/GDSL hydrolase family protein [Pseudomonadota bacterium]|nr:SGNH/GDSL hydrolase family protein [Pseudomonadota bacterium]